MKNLADLKKLYMDGFPQDTPEYVDYFFSTIKKQNIVTKFEEGKVVSAGYIVPKRAVVFNKMQNIAYLTGLSTLKEHRGKNKIADIVSQAFNKLFNRGYNFVALNPFNNLYYTRYGFSTVSHCSQIKLSGTEIFAIKIATAKDLQTMCRIEREMCQNCNSYLMPSKSRSLSKLKEFWADGAKAYIIYKDENPFAYYFDNEEISCYSTSNISDLFKARVLNGKNIINYFDGDDAFIQMRIVNVIGALKSFDFTSVPDMIKTFKVTDTIISANNVFVTLKVLGGKGFLSTAYSADNVIDIMQLNDRLFKNFKNLFVDKY